MQSIPDILDHRCDEYVSLYYGSESVCDNGATEKVGMENAGLENTGT